MPTSRARGAAPPLSPPAPMHPPPYQRDTPTTSLSGVRRITRYRALLFSDTGSCCGGRSRRRTYHENVRVRSCDSPRPRMASPLPPPPNPPPPGGTPGATQLIVVVIGSAPRRLNTHSPLFTSTVFISISEPTDLRQGRSVTSDCVVRTTRGKYVSSSLTCMNYIWWSGWSYERSGAVVATAHGRGNCNRGSKWSKDVYLRFARERNRHRAAV